VATRTKLRQSSVPGWITAAGFFDSGASGRRCEDYTFRSGARGGTTVRLALAGSVPLVMPGGTLRHAQDTMLHSGDQGRVDAQQVSDLAAFLYCRGACWRGPSSDVPRSQGGPSPVLAAYAATSVRAALSYPAGAGQPFLFS